LTPTDPRMAESKGVMTDVSIRKVFAKITAVLQEKSTFGMSKSRTLERLLFIDYLCKNTPNESIQRAQAPPSLLLCHHLMGEHISYKMSYLSVLRKLKN